MDTPPLAGIFVLLVEDETSAAPSLAPFLEHAGALVRSFPPAVAPGLVAHVRPDAVLAVLAPDAPSLALVRELRASDALVPIIAVAPEDVEPALREAGCQEILHRPLSATRLGEVIWRIAYRNVPAAHARPCVLIAEDHDDSRELLTVVLRGYDVIVATDGEEAIAQFQRHRPDVVILDVLMPVKDGIEAILAIRRLAPEARIIAMSGGWSYARAGRGEARPDVLAEARQLGADVTLRKPLEPRLVLDAVEGLLARS